MNLLSHDIMEAFFAFITIVARLARINISVVIYICKGDADFLQSGNQNLANQVCTVTQPT